MFANAGMNIAGDPHELALDEWQQVMDVNARGVFLANKYTIQQFQAQGRDSS